MPAKGADLGFGWVTRNNGRQKATLLVELVLEHQYKTAVI